MPAGSNTWLPQVIGALLSLGGVVVGFCLNAGWCAFTRCRELRRWQLDVENELRTNLGIIGDKLDIVRQIRAALIRKQILPGCSVHALTTAFDTHFSTIYHRLTPVERESLNVIYGSLKLFDVMMDAFEKDILTFLEFSKDKPQMDVYAIFHTRFGEIEREYKRTGQLISDYLAGKREQIHRQPWVTSRPTNAK